MFTGLTANLVTLIREYRLSGHFALLLSEEIGKKSHSLSFALNQYSGQSGHLFQAIRPCIPETIKKWPDYIGKGGRFESEWVAGLNRNHWPVSPGIRTIAL